MRVVKEIAHPKIKITIFSWNEKYLIKLEQGPLEQTFKVRELDLTSEADLDHILDDIFIQKALNRFTEMYESLALSMEKF